MATTYAPTHLTRDTRERRRGFFGRLLAHMMHAREMEAKRRIAGYTHLMSDEFLANAGLTRADLERTGSPRHL